MKVFPWLVVVFCSASVWGQVRFADVTREAGINFVHNNGAFGKKYLPETMGSGVAFFDYNNNGWLDILFINGTDWAERKRRTTYLALYRNNGNGTFTDVTRAAGLQFEFYGMGCAIADYDNDGYPDIYLTGLAQDRLFRNMGNGTFKDVTQQAGLGNPDFGTAAAWLDYDKDGHLDLFVANYVVWTAETDIFCSLDGTNKAYCTPESYRGVSPRLYRNLGNGKFQDVTARAGLLDDGNKGLGVAILDYNQNGWPDILLANDTRPNKLWENQGNGTFREVGLLAGVAYSEDGVARGAMGIDAGDYDHCGYPSIVIGNFSNEMVSLYHNEGNGFFIDEAPTSVVGPSSLLTLAFGAFFFDYNLNGFLDIYVANGHVEDDINRVQEKVTYAQPPHLFENVGGKGFREVTQSLGGEFAAPRVARGAAFGDFDRDGDLDLVVTTNGGPARLFRNDGGNRNNWVTFRLEGVESNRDGIGAVVRVKGGELSQWATVKSGSSYLSQSQLWLTFGLAQASRIESVEVEWPSGKKQRFTNVPTNRFHRIHEQDGLVADR